MNLAHIDNVSINGTTKIHKCGPAAKMIFAALLLFGFLFSRELEKIVFLILVIIIISIISAIPFKTALKLLLYPAFFSTFFALIIIKDTPNQGLIIMLKAIGSAFSMIWLILTTPYIEVFSILNLIFPSVIVDILFFTYRSFFILLGKLENILKSIKLKGGYHQFNFIKNIKNIAGIIGILIIHSFEASERMYKIYSLRGYDGKLPSGNIILIKGKKDYILIVIGIILIIGVLIPWNL